MKSKILTLALIVIILLSGCGSLDIDSFSGDNAYKHIEELSSDKYAGRLSGTEGNKKAEEYIKNHFKKIGLKPINEDSYYQEFINRYPVYKDPFRFNVVDDNGEIIKSYAYGKDYTEVVSNYGFGGKLKEKAKVINNLNEITNEKIILSKLNASNEIIAKELTEKGVKGIIRPIDIKEHGKGKDGDLISRAIALDRKEDINKGFIYLAVTKETYDEIEDYTNKGYGIDLNINVKFQNVKMNNVIGYIEGTDEDLKDETIIISGHFDHVGSDPKGNVYNGALDNASGTAMMMELARAIKESNIKPRRRIVFAAFNGEEAGLFGSDYYAYRRLFPLHKTKVINLDMIGSREDVKLELQTTRDKEGNYKSKDLVNGIANIAKDIEIEVNVKSDAYYSSDHYSFTKRGGEAITLIHSSKDLIHTPEDTIDNIDKTKLDQIGRLLMKAINYYGMEAKDNKFTNLSENQREIFKNIKIIIPILIALVILLFIIYKLLHKIDRLKNKPILSVLLFILILLSILIYNSNYKYENQFVTDYKPEPWEGKTKISSDVSNIYDLNINEDIEYIIKTDNIERVTLSRDGKVKERERLDIANKVDRVKEYKRNIYYLYNNNLYKDTSVISKDIDDFNLLYNQNKKYILTYNNKEISIIGDKRNYKIKAKDIEKAIGLIDNKGRIHIVFKADKDIRYIMINRRGTKTDIKQLYKLKEDSDINFGIDVGKGYIFFKEESKYKFLPFYLGSRKVSGLEPREIDVGGFTRESVKGNSIPYIVNGDETILFSIVGIDQYDKSYVYIYELYNGIIRGKTEVYQSDKDIEKAVFIQDKNKYVSIIEDGDLIGISSDKDFGEIGSIGKVLVKMGNIMKNLIYMVVLFFIKIHYILPGFIFLLILRIIKKDKWLDNKVFIIIALLINILSEVIFFNLPSFTGLRFENILMPIIFLIISLIIVSLYKKETKGSSVFKLFIIFSVINMIFITSLYSPLTTKGGYERIQNRSEKTEDNIIGG
ncbi:M20/M25/M40 family metallo-hydrolase [Dethiothermospora halolimnae]|uniref:M20/M25/M40 family metallo-hydrolase n=1 Tax=Dethiothermospora halolimnae TaxID=3114390 RepID=UPI003CCBAF31